MATARTSSRHYTPTSIGLSKEENRRRLEIQSGWTAAERDKRSCYPQHLYEWRLPIIRSPFRQDPTTGCLADKLKNEDESETQVRAFKTGLDRGLQDIAKASEEDDDDDQPLDTSV